jgi:hypothetical protein
MKNTSTELENQLLARKSLLEEELHAINVLLGLSGVSVSLPSLDRKDKKHSSKRMKPRRRKKDRGDLPNPDSIAGKIYKIIKANPGCMKPLINEKMAKYDVNHRSLSSPLSTLKKRGILKTTGSGRHHRYFVKD